MDTGFGNRNPFGDGFTLGFRTEPDKDPPVAKLNPKRRLPLPSPKDPPGDSASRSQRPPAK